MPNTFVQNTRKRHEGWSSQRAQHLQMNEPNGNSSLRTRQPNAVNSGSGQHFLLLVSTTSEMSCFQKIITEIRRHHWVCENITEQIQ